MASFNRLVGEEISELIEAHKRITELETELAEAKEIMLKQSYAINELRDRLNYLHHKPEVEE